MRSVDQYFRTSFKVFDDASCIVASTRIEDPVFLAKCLLVDQTTVVLKNPDSLQHRPHQLAVAVVDRKADIARAAQAVLASKCWFGGTSPYSVDVVLVNEWVKKDFVACCSEILKTESSALCMSSDSNSGKFETLNKVETSRQKGDMLLDIHGVSVFECTTG